MQQPIENNTPNKQSTSAQTAPAVTGKSGDPFKVWAIVFALLFFATAGFAVWQSLQLNSQSSKLSELEATNSQLAKSVIEPTEPDTGDGSDGDTPVSNETNKILAAVDAYTRAPAAVSGQTFEYEVMENAAGFARVNVTAAGEASGYAVIVKQVGDEWTVVSVGQDTPTQETIDKYAIPEGILN